MWIAAGHRHSPGVTGEGVRGVRLIQAVFLVFQYEFLLSGLLGGMGGAEEALNQQIYGSKK